MACTEERHCPQIIEYTSDISEIANHIPRGQSEARHEEDRCGEQHGCFALRSTVSMYTNHLALGYQGNRAPAKVDVTVQDRTKADRFARIRELQEKVLKATTPIDAEAE